MLDLLGAAVLARIGFGVGLPGFGITTVDAGVLFAAAIYLMLRRSVLKLALGLSLLANAANLVIFVAAGLTRGEPPLIADGAISPWKERITDLAERPNVYCKISGMVTEAELEMELRLDDGGTWIEDPVTGLSPGDVLVLVSALAGG